MDESPVAEVTVLQDPPWLELGTTLYHIGPVSVEVKGTLFRVGHGGEWRKLAEIPRLIIVLGAAYDGGSDG